MRELKFRTQKTKEYESGEVDYKVTINWRILNKCLGGDNA